MQGKSLHRRVFSGATITCAGVPPAGGVWNS